MKICLNAIFETTHVYVRTTKNEFNSNALSRNNTLKFGTKMIRDARLHSFNSNFQVKEKKQKIWLNETLERAQNRIGKSAAREDKCASYGCWAKNPDLDRLGGAGCVAGAVESVGGIGVGQELRVEEDEARAEGQQADREHEAAQQQQAAPAPAHLAQLSADQRENITGGKAGTASLHTYAYTLLIRSRATAAGSTRSRARERPRVSGSVAQAARASGPHVLPIPLPRIYPYPLAPNVYSTIAAHIYLL